HRPPSPLHDALPISGAGRHQAVEGLQVPVDLPQLGVDVGIPRPRPTPGASWRRSGPGLSLRRLGNRPRAHLALSLPQKLAGLSSPSVAAVVSDLFIWATTFAPVADSPP